MKDNRNDEVNKKLYGTDLFGNPIDPSIGLKSKLKQDFIMPPFSVFSSRDGYWQERKNYWLKLGIKSEIGRADDLTLNASSDSFMEEIINARGGGTSIFDPVLCELMYRYFCPADGQIIDCFAGGSVRGIVAAILGYRYWGNDLAEEQIIENHHQGSEICGDAIENEQLQWMHGDSLINMEFAPEADFLFSCPPYGDLEVYSDDENDLSTMSVEQFNDIYQQIIQKSCAKLRDNSFACFVVGNYRNRQGNLIDFLSSTIQAFQNAGLHYYNEGIFITPCGSLPVRIQKQFKGGRKLGKTHQNILVFVKGDGKKATKKIELSTKITTK